MLRRYLVGATLARTGDELSGPALLLLGLQEGPHAGAALLAGLTAAAAGGGPVFGAFLDRSPRPGRLLAAGLAGYAGGLAVVAAAFGHLPLASVVAVAVVTGLLNPAIAGGWTAQLPGVAQPRLEKASRQDALTFTAAALAGPGLAGLLGGPTGMVAAVLLVAAATPIAWRLPRKRPQAKTNLRDGFTILVRNASLRRATTASTISCAGIGMVTVCYPLLGAAHLRGPADGALLLTVLAVTSLLANAVFTRKPLPWSPDRIVLLSTLVLAASAALAAVGRDPVSLVAAAAIAGIAEGPQLTALFAIRHREAPEHVRAQVFTTAASVKITGLAAGAALAGPLAAWSLPACLLAAAVVQLGAAACSSRSERHRLRAPLDLGAVAGAQGVDRGPARQALVGLEEPAQHLGPRKPGVGEHRDRAGQALDDAVLDEEVAGNAQVTAALEGDQLPVAQHLADLVGGGPEDVRHLRQRKNRDGGVEDVVGDRNPTHT
ncbi:Predicted arabinose efflux permease, MFS family [Amycolatopsis pretoriensis]|uniref:Predicted arabinose efflux permease, MFS family n=1 Tax=Amycolatopsis pretoriensis TaxID=218821 RepID=A0A1H5R6L1_9PSEU|nr:Predicted arabinose efflux permease, MFS family [Amycolatopsis pretoriensis]